MTAPLDVAASGIVLAGGRSSRYGSDKLAARVEGATLLDRSVAALAAVAVEIVVVVAPGDDRVPAPIDRPLRLVADPELHGGPLVGLLAGLEAVDQPIALVVGGDMPSLRADVLRLMLRTLVTADEAFGAVILERRGRGEPLPAVVRTGSGTDVARRLVADGERSLRSLLERLPTRIIDEAAWRPLDPDAATLHDVDRPSDLES
ncbi:MAG TPA: molybdenum cofactor guanylyltransferase [Candidatus Limnocylindrales bacterium]|nr:molybdenum cofactor guanylyltransferase [Candidatus Limnocylindrales bacterium]